MHRYIQWAEKHPAVNIMIAAAFYLAVVGFHDEVTFWAIKIRKSIGVDAYNYGIALIALFTFLVIGGGLIWKIIRGKQLAFKRVYLILTSIFIVIFYRYGLVYNIETIHFFQYMILAILLFPVIRKYGETVFWVTVLGGIDEAYQYLILTPFYDYYDFNDVILNLLGAGFGVVAILILTDQTSRLKKWYYLPSAWFTVVLFVLMGVLFISGTFAFYPPVIDEAMIVLNRSHPGDSFWTEAYPGRVYHILRPVEGVALIYLLFVFYFGVDMKTVKNNQLFT